MTRNLILRVRTRTNLLELLEAGVSGDWKVAKEKEDRIKTVQVYNWDGSLMLESPLDLSKTTRIEDNRLVAGLSDTEAKIVKCIPPLQWQGQNPVNYVEVAEESQVEDNLSFMVANPPHFVADQSDLGEDIQDLSNVCQSQHGEPIQLVTWKKRDDANGFDMIFREIRRGLYYELNMFKEDGEWVADRGILPAFLPVLESDAGDWTEFTAEAPAENWIGFDYIIYTTQVFPDAKLYLAGEDLIGEKAADEAVKNFGFYIPDSRNLPGFLCRHHQLKVGLCALSANAGASIDDNNAHVSSGAKTMLEAAHKLYDKLCHYAQQKS